MAEIRTLLDDALEEEIENLSDISDREEKTKAIRDIAQLHKLRTEEIRIQIEADDKSERREMDSKKNEADLALKEREADEKDADRIRESEVAKQQIRENKIDRYMKFGATALELLATLGFYGLWMKRGFEFERSGSFTSTTFKNLLNRFRPTK